jgi:hypothetical protein
VGGPEDGKLVVKTLVVKFRSIEAHFPSRQQTLETLLVCFDTHIGDSVLKIFLYGLVPISAQEMLTIVL